MNIIDERNVRTVYRKLRKQEYDEVMKLSVKDSEQVRLLDEGMVVDAGGYPLFYIKKGVLSAYLKALPDDYVGSINMGHMNFATFPILLGKWTKKDLHLVDIGDGRHALEVDLHLDEENVLVRELRRAEYTLGVSAEFSYHVDERNSEKYQLEILDKIFISNFAIVGEAGNVNSSDIRLGGNMTVKDLEKALDGGTTDLAELNKKLDALLDAEGAAEAPVPVPVVEEPVAEEPEAEPVAEEPAAEPVEEEPAAEEPEAEPVAEESAEDAEAEPAADEAEGEGGLSVVAAALATIQRENEALKEENAKLTARLAAIEQAEKDFIEKFKNLSVSLSGNTESVTEDQSTEDVFTDGIGA